LDGSHNPGNRIDAQYFDPRYEQLVQRLEDLRRTGKFALSPLGSLLAKSKTRLTGGMTPKGAAYLSEGIRFIRVQNVREGRIFFEKAVFIPRIIHETALKRSKLKPLDVVLTITGWTYGIAAVVPENAPNANINQHSVKMEVDRTLLDPYYLSCYLNCELCKGQIDRAVTGSTRPALDYSAIESLIVAYPPDVQMQATIGKSVQARYDKAYQHLQRRDELLAGIDEEIQNTLGMSLPRESAFRSFIDDLLATERLDAVSRSPYLKQLRDVIRAHPHDELGNIVSSDQVTTPAFTDYYRLVDIRNIEEKTGIVKVVETPTLGSGKILLKKGQILISGLNPDKGKVIYVDEALDGCVGSLEFIPVRLKTDDVELDYLLAISRSKLVTDQWKYQITGSTPSRERVDEECVLRTLVPRPGRDIQRKVVEAVSSKVQQAISLEQQCHSEIREARELFMKTWTFSS